MESISLSTLVSIVLQPVLVQFEHTKRPRFHILRHHKFRRRTYHPPQGLYRRLQIGPIPSQRANFVELSSGPIGYVSELVSELPASVGDEECSFLRSEKNCHVNSSSLFRMLYQPTNSSKSSDSQKTQERHFPSRDSVSSGTLSIVHHSYLSSSTVTVIVELPSDPIQSSCFASNGYRPTPN